MYDDDVIFGRMPVGMDESEFDFVPPLHAQWSADDATWIQGDDPSTIIVAPPVVARRLSRRPAPAPSSEAAAALAASKARLAAIQAQLDATKLAIAQGTWTPPGTTEQQGGYGVDDGDYTYDGGDGYTADDGSYGNPYNMSPEGATALQRFRQSGGAYDPFEDATEMTGDVLLGLAEVADILADTYEREITDEPPDYERRRASVHRGAAYLQDIDYPPHGVSSGQQGGSIVPSHTFDVFGKFGLDALRARRAFRRGR